jgi:hypothetical protein
MQKQLFDTGWEFTDAQGMFGPMATQWQPISLRLERGHHLSQEILCP